LIGLRKLLADLEIEESGKSADTIPFLGLFIASEVAVVATYCAGNTKPGQGRVLFFINFAHLVVVLVAGCMIVQLLAFNLKLRRKGLTTYLYITQKRQAQRQFSRTPSYNLKQKELKPALGNVGIKLLTLLRCQFCGPRKGMGRQTQMPNDCDAETKSELDDSPRVCTQVAGSESDAGSGDNDFNGHKASLSNHTADNNVDVGEKGSFYFENNIDHLVEEEAIEHGLNSFCEITSGCKSPTDDTLNTFSAKSVCEHKSLLPPLLRQFASETERRAAIK